MSGFASHCGFRPDWCEAADPASKRIVEHLCGYAQTDLVIPLLTEAKVTGQPVNLPAANTVAATWCAEVNAATHSEIAAVPDERLAADRELWAPLPSLRPEIGFASVTRKVDRLSCIRYGSARYSVPTRLIGASVAVVIDHGALLVVEPGTGAIVAEHDLVAPGETSVLDEHYDGPRPMPSRGPRRKPQWNNNSALSVTMPRHSWSVRPQSATPAWVKSCRSSWPWVPPTARPCWRRRCTGGWRSNGSVPPTCAPSSPPVPPPRSPAHRQRAGAGSAHRADAIPGRLQDHRQRRECFMTTTGTKTVVPTTIPPPAADLDAVKGGM